MFSDSMKTNELEIARFVESRKGNPMLLDKGECVFFSLMQTRHMLRKDMKKLDTHVISVIILTLEKAI